MVKAGRPLIFFRIGRLGMVMSKVPSCVPKMGSCSFPSSQKVWSFAHTFIANSNWRTRLAQPTNAAMPRSCRRRGHLAAEADHKSPSPDHLPLFTGGIARVHAPDAGPERAAIAVRVHLCEIKIVAALRISAELWIVLIRRQDKRSAAPPSSHQLGSY